MLEFEVLEKGRSQISAFWSLAITASPSGFKKLSTVLLFAFLTNENFILYHSVDVIWDKLIRGCATNLHNLVTCRKKVGKSSTVCISRWFVEKTGVNSYYI